MRPRNPLSDPSRLRHVHPAVTVVEAASPRLPLVLSCEHASADLPPPWQWPEADRRLLRTHWSWDRGAAELTLELAEALGVGAVLARFTRLLIDPNRPLDSPTLCRAEAEGLPVQLNQDLSEEDRAARIAGWWQPYHDAFDDLVRRSPGAHVLSVHGFTPVYEGQPRAVQLGVLWDADADDGRRLLAALDEGVWDVRGNEPYSGIGGFMYSAQHHAARHGRRAVELEVRDDLLTDPVARGQIGRSLVRALGEVFG